MPMAPRKTLLRIACLLALLSLSATAAAATATTAKKHHRRVDRPSPASACRRGRPHTLAADAQAQVYVMRNSFGGQSVMGCAYRQGRPFLLGPLPDCATPGGCLGVKTVALAGPIVAYGSFTEIEPSVPSEAARRNFVVVVRDLRTTRLLRITPTGIPATQTPGVVGVGQAVAIVVKSDGAVAWIAENEGAPAGARYEVHAADTSGSLRLLAWGAAIDPSSLRLAGSTLYWVQAGQAMSSSLS
jgi:hypothetical protein